MTRKSLSQSDLDFFHREGYVRLNGLHAKTVMKSLRAKVLDELSRLKIWSNGKRVGSSLGNLPAFQQIVKLSSMVNVPDLDAALITPEVQGAVTGIAGKAPRAGQGSQLLLSLPNQGRWSLANLNWHVDLASSPDGEMGGVQVFHLIDDVVPQGGATLALARSHRMPEDVAGRLRGALKTSAEPDDILRAYDTEIVEMSGRAGDVFLMDMRVLHSPSINASRNIRMMATSRFDLRAADRVQ